MRCYKSVHGNFTLSTIPVTYVKTEISISKLKIIKKLPKKYYWTRSTKTFAVENETASTLKLSEVINKFANIKARKTLN